MATTAKPSGRMDLHLHSDRSDGRYPPEAVLDKAWGARLEAIALTDHDLPPPLTPGIHRQGDRCLRLIAGSEVTTIHEGTEQHLLAYFPSAPSEEAAAFLHERALLRSRRMAEAARRLGLGDDWLDPQALAGHRTVTRLTLARRCVFAGRARSTEEAFATLLAPGNGLLEPVELPFPEALRLLLAMGAVTSWAHPAIEQARAWMRDFARTGLHAVEALRPGVGRHTRVALRKLADRHGLTVTGGSDWHGYGPRVLGAFSVRGEQISGLLTLLDGVETPAEIVSSVPRS
jgi:3',5'-nucleoside bisphosphate phosphatase